MQIIDYDMPYEQFLAIFEGVYAEWVDGVVYQLPKHSVVHQTIQKTLTTLFDYYLDKYPQGRCISAPTLLRVNNLAPARCPDVQIHLSEGIIQKQSRAITGPADVVVEIISEVHHTLERADKFVEYEQGGVGEYWIIDPIRQDCLFYVLESNYFRLADTDKDGIYRSKRLQNFNLPTNFLWSQPTDDQIKQLADTM